MRKKSFIVKNDSISFDSGFSKSSFPKERKRASQKEHKGRRRFKWWIIPIVVLLVAGGIFGYANITRELNGAKISSVVISSLPYKTEYYIGEQPDYTGFAITTTYNDGTTLTEGADACTFSGFDSEFAADEQQITVTYGEYVFIFDVAIKEPVRVFSPLVRISLETLPKTEYKVGDWLSVENGVLVLEYEDGSSRRIQLKYGHIYDFSTEKPGKFTVTVKLREDGYLATTTYDVTVSE